MAQSGNRLLKLRSELGDPSERFFELSERFVQSIDDAKVAAHEYFEHAWYVLDKNSVALWPMSIFIITAIYCMSCSSLYHLFSSMDEKTVDHYKKLDAAGISLLILGLPTRIFTTIFARAGGWPFFWSDLQSFPRSRCRLHL